MFLLKKEKKKKNVKIANFHFYKFNFLIYETMSNSVQWSAEGHWQIIDWDNNFILHFDCTL